MPEAKQTTVPVRAVSVAVQAFTAPIPRPVGSPAWLPGLRVVLALYAPLLVGMAVGRIGVLVPFAVGALAGALADPGGSRSRRALTIGATSLLGAAVFGIGDLVGSSPAGAIVFVAALLFVTGLAPEFGSSGTRAALYVATLGILGVSSAGIDPGWITPTGLLVGGLWALALAIGPFAQNGLPINGIEAHANRIATSVGDHLMLRTAIGRQAARMAVAGGLGIALSLAMGRGHIGWIAGAAVAVLHPRVTACATRSIRLIVGTVVGALAVTLLLEAIGPGSGLLVLAAPLLLLAVSVRSVDYVFYTVAFTAFMVALSSFSERSAWMLFDARVIDTLLGVGIALAVWAITMPAGERARLDCELRAR